MGRNYMMLGEDTDWFFTDGMALLMWPSISLMSTGRMRNWQNEEETLERQKLRNRIQELLIFIERLDSFVRMCWGVLKNESQWKSHVEVFLEVLKNNYYLNSLVKFQKLSTTQKPRKKLIFDIKRIKYFFPKWFFKMISNHYLQMHTMEFRHINNSEGRNCMDTCHLIGIHIFKSGKIN